MEGRPESARPKRLRVARACEHCRQKKYRCDGHQPICSRCTTLGIDCIYETAVRKRGLQTGYVKSMECLWALVFENIEGSEEAAKVLLDRHLRRPRHIPPDHEETLDGLAEKWRASTVAAALAKTLHNDTSVSLSGSTSPEIAPQATQKWFLLDAAAQPTLNNLLPTSTVPHESPAASIEQPRIHDTPTLRTLPIHWFEAIQAYLVFEYCWLPVIDRNGPYRIVEAYLRHVGRPLVELGSKERGEYALLWAVLLLGDAHVNGVQSRDISTDVAHCWNLLTPDVITAAHHTCARVYVLLALLYYGQDNMVISRLMLAQARVLCLPVGDEDIPMLAESDRARNLVSSACFLLDSLIAIRLDEAPCMSSDDLLTLDPCDESSADEWEPFNYEFRGSAPSHASRFNGRPSHIASTFNSLIKLFCVLNNGLRQSLSSTQLLTHLEAWKLQMPSQLRIPSGPNAPATTPELPQYIHVHLLYYTTRHLLNSQRSSRLASDNTGNGSAFDVLITTHLRSLLHNFGIIAFPASSRVFWHVSSAHSHPTTLVSNDENSSIAILYQFASRWTPMGSQRQVLEDRVAVQSGSAAQAYEIITRPATDPQMSETLVRNIDNTVSFDQDMPPMSDPEGLGLDPNTRPSHTLMPPLSNEEDESGQSAHSINLMDYLATLETLNTDESSTRFAQALGFGGNFDPDSLLL